MRVSNWNPKRFDGEIITAGMDRLEKAAEVIASGARKRIHSISGNLKTSVRVTRLKDDTRRNVRVYAGTSASDFANYAYYVEYGTEKMKAKPFLRPALNAAKPQIQSILRNGE